jgi:hypothetical protein
MTICNTSGASIAFSVEILEPWPRPKIQCRPDENQKKTGFRPNPTDSFFENGRIWLNFFDFRPIPD